ncbi:MAG TPA: DUF2306 domain-containing protein [Candidatus Acidoferrum sp.]|jgi:uncharacterized membrane protein
MATSTMSLQQSSWLRPKYLLFGVIGLMLGYVLVHNESFLIHPKDPIWNHYRTIKWWLLPHGIMGACALLLGPMQFSDRLRQRFAKFHRVIGRFYVAGVFFAAPFGLYIQYYAERTGGPRSFTLAAMSQAALWILTTAIAMFFILKGKTQQHRQWMTRSFAIALVFLEVRVVSGLMGLDNSLSGIETIVWMCNVFALLFADIILQLQESLRTRSATARVPVGAPAVAPAASD